MIEISLSDASQAEFDGVSEVRVDTSGQSESATIPLQTLISALHIVMILMQ